MSEIENGKNNQSFGKRLHTDVWQRHKMPRTTYKASHPE